MYTFVLALSHSHLFLYEELRTLFNGIFKYAMASGAIQTNPVALIQFKRAARVNRESLSKTEIKAY